MDYEKKYNEALEHAQAEILANPGLRKTWEEIFPELRESEDERIRKWIASYIHHGVFTEDEHPMALKAVEWLEKQKESLHIPETCKENAEYFTSQCGDNRFELIDKAKRDIIAKTNIESSPDEMKVLDSFLFRAWQMGWLGKYDVIVPEQKPAWSEEVKWLVDDDYDELTDKGRFILGSVGLGHNGYYIPYSDLLKLPKEDEK